MSDSVSLAILPETDTQELQGVHGCALATTPFLDTWIDETLLKC